jgi:hypothetical protein
MAELNYEDEAKRVELQLMQLRGESPRVVEVVAVHWPQPTGTVYYASTQYDDLFRGLPFAPVEARLRYDKEEPFCEVLLAEGISDEEVDLALWDADGVISDLLHAHGAGLRVEIFYHFPDIDWTPSLWWGHLQQPEEAGEDWCETKAEQGFRSSMLPCPRRAHYVSCQALYPPEANLTQAEIDEGDCPVNAHLPGGTIGNTDPSTGKVYAKCARTRPDCIKIIGDALSFLADDTVVETIINNQTKGGALFPESRGNATNLKKPKRVIAGTRVVRDCEVLEYTPQLNTKHPDEGFVRAQIEIGEGRIRSMVECKVNDTLIGFQHLNTRNGARRQPATNFSPNASNHSGTAHFFAVYGPVNPSGYGPNNLRGSAKVEGCDDVRVYTSETEFAEEWTDSRAWWLCNVLRHKRWGYGLDVARFWIEKDFIPLHAWTRENTSFTAKDGTVFTGPRTLYNAELNDRTIQQVVNDICLAGRFGLPFQFDGKLRVVPLKKLTADELAAAQVFTDCDDFGFERNIVRDDGKKSTLTRSFVSDRELPNRVVVTFDDAEHGNVERPLSLDDTTQQLLAGRAFVDTTQRVVEKKYALGGSAGVTRLGEAGRLMNLLLDLGPFDEGGLRNNLRINFVTWYAFTLGLHKYKVIRVLSRQLTRYGFEYFRIRSLKRLGNLKVEISAQAYPVDYYEQMEAEAAPRPVVGGDINPGGGHGARPHPVEFGDLDFGSDRIHFRVSPVVVE